MKIKITKFNLKVLTYIKKLDNNFQKNYSIHDAVRSKIQMISRHIKEKH